MADEPTTPAPAPVRFAASESGGLMRVCPYCGGKLFEYTDADFSESGSARDVANPRTDDDPEFCCTYQRDIAKRKREAAKRGNAVGTPP